LRIVHLYFSLLCTVLYERSFSQLKLIKTYFYQKYGIYYNNFIILGKLTKTGIEPFFKLAETGDGGISHFKFWRKRYMPVKNTKCLKKKSHRFDNNL